MITEIKTFAPVVIPTLCRFEHLKRLCESLERCKYADKTEVYIAVDYPSKPTHLEGHSKIVSYLKGRKFNFAKLHLIFRDRNYGFGPNGNFSNLIKEVVKSHDRYIFSEDDNEFAPGFLDYMNQCLEKYADNPKIFSICGYMFKDLSTDDVYSNVAMPLYCAWGTGFWVNKRLAFDEYFKKEKLLEIVENPFVHRYFSKYRKQLYLTLMRMIKTGERPGDVIVSGYLIHKDMKCIFPARSYVRNWGWDGSGTHGGRVEGYNTQDLEESCSFMFNEAPSTYSEDLCKRQYSNWRKSDSFARKIETLYSWYVLKITGVYHDLQRIKRLKKHFNFF